MPPPLLGGAAACFGPPPRLLAPPRKWLGDLRATCRAPVEGFFVEALSPVALEEAKANGRPLEEFSMFCHSPESWRKLWVEDVFDGTDGKGEERVKVDAGLTPT